MTNPSTSENSIQKDILKLLQSCGYKYISPDDMQHYRNSYRNVILEDVLLDTLKRINSFEYKGDVYDFSDANLKQAVRDLDVPLVEGLISVNEMIYDRLVLGETYEETLIDGSKSSFSLKYIDFDDFSNNVFHVTEEFIVEKAVEVNRERTKRADIVLFVNGIPLGVIELKKSSVKMKKGIEQIIYYQKDENIPLFFRYIQITLAGNTSMARYGTAGTPANFYNVWNEEEFKEDDYKCHVEGRDVTFLDKTVFSVFYPERFLEIMLNYIIFDKNVKKIARYQQFFAIRRILENIVCFDNTGRRKGGLVWHTQGSGKSLTMVMLAKKLKNTVNNSRIVVVTDRINLDKQIKRTFQHSGFEVKRANTGSKLAEYIESSNSEIITTVINKFESVVKSNIKTKNPNIFILVDESHRTQYGTLASRMRNVFPSACYIGFTGTPIMRVDKNSAQRFGGIIHKYTIDKAVADKAVLPLLYEGRIVDQDIFNNSSMDRKFDFITRNLNDDEKADLKKKWAKLQNITASEERLEVVALDINRHFVNNWKNTGIKAMLTTNSKYEAIKYHNIFEKLDEVKTAYVISPPEVKEGHDSLDNENRLFVQNEWSKLMNLYNNVEDYEKTVIDNFVNGDGSDDNDIDILIVVDKLLTGFDAPRAGILYIDKDMQDYRLLQAIARVNRLYPGKDYGYILDYRGLLGNLDKALTVYSALSGFEEEDIVNTVFDINQEIVKLKGNLIKLHDIFDNVEYKSDLESYLNFLEDDKIRKDFYKKLKDYAKKLKICLSCEGFFDKTEEKDIKNYNNEVKFFNELRKASRIRFREAIDFSEFEPEMRKLLDTYIAAGEVNQLTKIVNIFEKDFDSEIERINGKKSKADTIKNAIVKVVSEKMEENPDYYGKISDRIKRIIFDY
ncbi:MAG: type I restriction endonuclease subunit R, partial [Candidatus Muirbacterium halophilum]|nr:type I restriction endonuclease subunit R [Candidatus Muirbacterium halophilum]